MAALGRPGRVAAKHGKWRLVSLSVPLPLPLRLLLRTALPRVASAR